MTIEEKAVVEAAVRYSDLPMVENKLRLERAVFGYHASQKPAEIEPLKRTFLEVSMGADGHTDYCNLPKLLYEHWEKVNELVAAVNELRKK